MINFINYIKNIVKNFLKTANVIWICNTVILRFKEIRRIIVNTRNTINKYTYSKNTTKKLLKKQTYSQINLAFLNIIKINNNYLKKLKIITISFKKLYIGKNLLKNVLKSKYSFKVFFKHYINHIEKVLWSVAYYFTFRGLKYRRIRKLSKRLGRHKKKYIIKFIKERPEVLTHSKLLYGKYIFKNINLILNRLSIYSLVRMNLRFNTKLAFRIVKRKIRNLGKWSYKKLKQRFKRRRAQMRLSQSWGNAGKHHFLRYKKERFLMQREIIMITGKEYYSKKTGIFKENRLKFDKFVSFPLPKVKRNIRTRLSGNAIKWLNSGYHVLECSKFVDLKFSLLTITSNHANVGINSNKFGHVFHLVSPSILPITFSWVLFLLIQDLLNSFWLEFWFLGIFQVLGHVSIASFLFATILTWILEIYSEEQSGAHTLEVQKGFRYAILLFILSELMLFISFFWAYFHFSLNSNSFTGGTYTPNGIVPFYWFRIPLLNTLLLLASGLSLTIAHILMIENDKFVKVLMWLKVFGNFRFSNWFRSILKSSYRSVWYKGYKFLVRYKWFLKRMQNAITRFSLSKKKSTYVKNFEDRSYNHLQRFGRVATDFQINLPRSFLIDFRGVSRETGSQCNFWLIDTVIKGFIFLIYQAYEYTSCMFSINDGVYGAVFFSLTGLHGLHVFIGVMFIFISFSTNLKKSYGRFYSSKKTWRRFIHVYLDKGTLPKNSYNQRLWTNRIAFDGAAWYWHFVDVVWLFVFIFVYWWGFSIV